MPFPFSHLCSLLNDLERLHIRNNPLLPRDLLERSTRKTNQWLKKHKFDLNAFDTQEAAVLWVLRPDKLTERCYGIDKCRLESIIARVYQVSQLEYAKLQLWQHMLHPADLAECVKAVRDSMTVPTLRTWEVVTVEEIECTLLRIASGQKGSSATIRSIEEQFPAIDVLELLQSIYERLNGDEAKWLTRYILKDYGAIFLPDSWDMEAGILGLPNVAKITLNLFSKPPPVEALLGTRVVKGHLSPRHFHEVASLGSQLKDGGWPRRLLVHSREASPISQPLRFAKGVLTPQIVLPDQASRRAPKAPGPNSPIINTLKLQNTPVTVSHGEGVLPSSTTLVPYNTTIYGSCSQLRPVLGSITSNVSKKSQDMSENAKHGARKPRQLVSFGGTGVCQLSRTSACPLANCILILSPCVAAMAHVSRELLHWHGTLFTRSARSLANPAFPVSCPRTQLRYRKIILINTHNRIKTVDFLREVQNLKLQLKVCKGKRKSNREKIWTKEWLEVYDWRLLEAIGKIDQGKVYNYDVWKRNFIGTI